MTRGKRGHTLALRVDEETLREVDDYQRQREAEARVPLSRGLVLLEIVDGWARSRRDARGKKSG